MVIPVPEAETYTTYYDRLYNGEVSVPKQLIHIQRKYSADILLYSSTALFIALTYLTRTLWLSQSNVIHYNALFLSFNIGIFSISAVWYLFLSTLKQHIGTMHLPWVASVKDDPSVLSAFFLFVLILSESLITRPECIKLVCEKLIHTDTDSFISKFTMRLLKCQTAIYFPVGQRVQSC